MIKLGVNIDHVATLRQSRGGKEPDPVWAAAECELAGAHCITIHLREDRRHIQDRDLRLLRETVQVKLNLEMANTFEMVDIASKVRPDQVTLVPEKRQELTTEGGLDAVKNLGKIQGMVKKLQGSGITISLFIDPVKEQIEASSESGAEFIEFHTGEYANAVSEKLIEEEFARLVSSADEAHSAGLRVNAGHGLNYQNIAMIRELPHLEELNIGHSIISRAVFVGLRKAVAEMLSLMNPSQNHFIHESA
jgi:pyridoxine 5-phosphate synthase